MGDPDRLRSPSTFNPLLDSRRAAGQKLAAGIPGTIGAQRGAKSTAAAGSGSSRDGAEQWSRVGGRAVSTPYDGVGGRSYVPEEVRDGVHRRRGRGGAVDVAGMLTPSLSFQSPEGAVFQTREQREAAVALLELFQRADGDRQPSVNVPVEQQAGVADRGRDGGGATGSHRTRRSRLSETDAGGSNRSSTSQVSAAMSMTSINSHLQRELSKIESEIAELTRIKQNEARSYADMQPSTRSAEEQRRSGVLQSGQAGSAAVVHRRRRPEYLPVHTLQPV